MDDPVTFVMVGCLEFVAAFFIVIAWFEIVLQSKR